MVATSANDGRIGGGWMNASHTGAARTALSTAAHMAAVLSAAAVGLALVLTLSTPAEHRALEMGPTPVVGLLAAAVGALILAQRPRNPIAWLLLISGYRIGLGDFASALSLRGIAARAVLAGLVGFEPGSGCSGDCPRGAESGCSHISRTGQSVAGRRRFGRCG